ncbi:MAG: flavodoxin family protein [Anaerolineae bacterium]
MKILLVSGSRNVEGQTARAAKALLTGAKSVGAEATLIFLPEHEIACCRQCDADGWGDCRAKGTCVIEDDLPRILDAMRGADLLAFATPVYYGTLSESLRACLDRVRRVCTHEEGRVGIRGKRALGLCVAGGGGGGSYTCAVDLERVLTSMGLDVMSIVPARRQNLDASCQMLERLGAWAAIQQPAS